MEVWAYIPQSTHQGRAVYFIALFAVHRRLRYAMGIPFSTAAEDAYRSFLWVYEQQNILWIAQRMNGILVDADTVFLYVYQY